MTTNISEFLASEDAVTSVEYALLLSLIVLVAFTTWQSLSHVLVASLNRSVNALK